MTESNELRWIVDGLRMDTPHGPFLIRVFKDGTACATRIAPGKKGAEARAEIVVSPTEIGVSLEKVKLRCEERVQELESKS